MDNAYIVEYEAAKVRKGYLEPLSTEQQIECAFAAGFRVGYMRCTQEMIDKVNEKRQQEIDELRG